MKNQKGNAAIRKAAFVFSVKKKTRIIRDFFRDY